MITKYSSLKKASSVTPLPAQVKAAFVATGEKQRGKAEDAMLKIQRVAGGGVLSVVVEHAGDLIHRMSHMVGWDSYDSPYRTGFEYVSDKVKKVLGYLTNDYGFEREMLQNLRNNAKHGNTTFEELKAKVDALLLQYAKHHANLEVYNRAQWLARETCMSLGQQDWDSAVTYLQELKSHCGSVKEWDDFASQYTLAEDGTVEEYLG